MAFNFTQPFFGLFNRGGGQQFPIGAGLSGQQRPTARRTVGQQPRISTVTSPTPLGPARPPVTAPRAPSGPPVAPTPQPVQRPTTPTVEGPSELQLRQQEVTGVFDPQAEFLQGLLSQAQAGQGEFLGGVAGQFEAQRPLLEQARVSGLADVERRRGETQRREQTAIGEARRLANELQQRNLQQFGTGSAGQFAQEFQGRELQRGLGGIRQTTSANLQALGQQSADIQANFEAQIQQLEAQKQAAVQQARDRFQDRINQIQSQQGGLASERAAALADAARELRAEEFNIEQNENAFRQGLQDQFQQVAIQLAGQQQQRLIEAGLPIDLSQLQGAVLPQLGGFQQAFADQLPQGQVRREEEPQGQLFRPEETA